MLRKILARAIPFFLVALVLGACATQPPIPEVQEPSTIKAATPGFSPTGDESTRSMELMLGFGHREAVQAWTVKIASGAGIVREFSGTGPELPSSLSWDGRAGLGLACPEGEYYAMFTVSYGEAFNPSPVTWVTFKLISSPPVLRLASIPESLTPAGEGMVEPARIEIAAKSTIAKVARYSIDILDEGGALVRSFPGAEAAPEGGSALSGAALWDGMTDALTWALPSREYRARARAVDEYGNLGEAFLAIPVGDRADAAEPSAIVPTSPGFSPTGDAPTRTIGFDLSFGHREELRSWTVEFVSSGSVLKRIEGIAPDLPASLSWDGKSDAGTTWPEGEYAALLSIDYGVAYKPVRVQSAPFILVSSKPAIALSATPPAFTPSGKGMAEPVVVAIGVGSPFAKAADWKLDVLDPRGEIIRSYTGSGSKGRVSWDGITKAGAWVEPSKTYKLRVTARDEYGNAGESQLDVAVRAQPNAPESCSVVPASSGFSPTGVPSRRTMSLGLSFGSREAIQSWTVEIMTGPVALKKYLGTGKSLPSSLSWDGKSETGSMWPEGEYFATLSVDYGNAFNPVKVISSSFILVSSSPIVMLSAKPSFFTPAGKGMEEPVSIGIDVSSRYARAAAWTVDMLDSRGETVRSFSGTGAAGKILWDGVTKAGAWVEPLKSYRAKATARDEYGNSGVSQLEIAVRAQPEAPESCSIVPASAGFSPTGDPSRRTLNLGLSFGSREAIQSWTVEIMTGSVALKKYSGDGKNLPSSLAWDGKSETGSIWPEGEYKAALSVDYGNAFTPVKVIGSGFILVSSPPIVRLAAKPSFFTPSAKGMEEPVSVGIEVSSRYARAAAWTIDMIDPRGETVRSFSGTGEAGKILWDGITKAGTWVEPSTTYKLRGSARDEYGNIGDSELPLLVHAQPDAPERSSIAAAQSGFSPTGDPARRKMGFVLGLGNRDSIQSWKVEVMTGSVAVKTFSGTAASLPSAISWDGISETGSIWPEGEYYPSLALDYGNAFNPAKAIGPSFYLVSTPPSVSLSASPPSFTPKGSSMEGPVSISIEAESRLAKIADWTIELKDEGGAVFKTFSGSGSAGQVSWDGALKSGAFADPLASYLALATARDEYGNATRSSLTIAVRDRPDAPEASFIQTEQKGFSPTSNRNGGLVDFSLMIGNAEAMSSWKVEVAQGALVRKTFSGGALEASVGLSWDGRDEAGSLAAEGSYEARLSIEYGRTFKPVQAKSKEFLLASSPPTGRLSFAPSSFVPSEKGVAAPVAIMLEAGSKLGRIESWTLDIQDDKGALVQTFVRTWPANQVVWDGAIPSGGFVEPSSFYQAKALIVDEYGNAGVATASIGVQEIPSATEASLIVPRSTGFSPIASGKPRSIDFVIKAGNLSQMKFWKVAMVHAERGTQKTFTGNVPPAGSLSWDGKTDGGAPAPDGSYYATLAIDYGKAFKPSSSKSEAFALQAAPPELSLSLSPARLTPRAGAFEKPVLISLRAASRFAAVEGWTISILDQGGATIAFWKDSAPSGRVSWDGKTSAGSYVEASSTCTLLAEARDGFGNVGAAKAFIPVEDLPPVPGENSITPAAKGLSPNGDGTMDSLDLLLSVAHAEALRSWKVVVSHAEKGAQKTFSGDAASLGAAITWTGRNDSGGPSPEGAYAAELSLDYGTMYKAAQAASRRFVLDATPPSGKVTISPAAALPDEDGFVAPALIELDASSPLARMASWKLRISDMSGKALKAFEGSWPPGSIAWDGRAEDGSLAQPKTSYAIEATVRDEFGISGRLSATLAVDALPEATEESGIAAASRGFSPAAGAFMKFSLAFGNRNLIKSWSVDVEREDRTVRMSFPGLPSELPDAFSWNGRLQDGTTAPDGRYIATLSVQYGRVYAPVATASQLFVLAASSPECSLAISPELFSPDGDGEAETLDIKFQAVSRLAAISDWNVDIFDPGGNLFANFKGQGPIPPIAWNGRNAKGEAVESAEDYPVVARARDEFGNVGEAKSAAHVDILVVRAGEGYRIRVASIVFKSFTADYLDVPADRAERNVTTLNLLADKLRKFAGYQVRIVGHAVMVNWDDPAKGKAEQEKVLLPLSRSRADSIKQALATRGIEASRMATDGVGAADQIVPDSDFENRWKNRRVEFFLQRKK